MIKNYTSYQRRTFCIVILLTITLLLVESLQITKRNKQFSTFLQNHFTNRKNNRSYFGIDSNIICETKSPHSARYLPSGIHKKSIAMNSHAKKIEVETNKKNMYYFSSTVQNRTYRSPFAQTILDNSEAITTPSNSHDTLTFLIILNRPVLLANKRANDLECKSLFEYLWEKSSLRICADGGANRLYNASNAQAPTQSTNMVPDLIVGDLDSVTDTVRDYYENQGTVIYRDSDQYKNDLDKAMQAICDYKKGTGCILEHSQRLQKLKINTKSSPKVRICIYGAFGGRFDQSMASIQALYRWSKEKILQNDDLILYTEETSAYILHPNIRYTIEIERTKEGPACGLIPIGGKCDACWSEGLQWDLDENMGPMEFGGLVSTSNVIDNDCVKIECSQPLIWTTEMRNFIQ